MLSSSEIVETAKRGRKIVILGDTSDSTSIEQIAMDADLLVHESTNAFIKEFEKDKGSTPQVSIVRDLLISIVSNYNCHLIFLR